MNAPSGLKQTSKKHQQLNPFLSKTYHMVNNSNLTNISWTRTGDSFMIKNVEEFSKKTLPLYFKHSKFSSFVRQLNFYGFRKIRADSSVLKEDEELEASSVRFYHEYFQAGKPKLLCNISRTTKSVDEPNLSQIDQIRSELDHMKEKLGFLTDEMDAKLAKLKVSMELDYQRRIVTLESAYRQLVLTVLQDRIRPSPSRTLNTEFVPIISSPQSDHHRQRNQFLVLSNNQHNNIGQANLLKATSNKGSFGAINVGKRTFGTI